MRSLITEILATEPILDPEEEAFVVFSQDIPSQSLGFIDSQDPTLEITVAGHDLVIHHSKGLLTSNRSEGTTGAMVWKVTPLFATWISSPTNFLFTNQLITPSSTILELGAGVSGIVALCLGSRVASYTATDQDYVLKLLRQNIAENLGTVIPVKKNSGRGSKKHQGHSKSGGGGGGGGGIDRITTLELDWETDATFHLNPVDMIVACDCVYNEALVEPLNATYVVQKSLKLG
ncbi:unnamed protein product [Alternaria alternata]